MQKVLFDASYLPRFIFYHVYRHWVGRYVKKLNHLLYIGCLLL